VSTLTDALCSSSESLPVDAARHYIGESLLCPVLWCDGHVCLLAGVSPNLLFEWAMPVLSGQGIGVWTHLDMSVQCWVLVALKEGLAAVEMPVLHQHALAVLTLCHSLLRSEGTSVHLIAPVLGLVSEVPTT
jgi:prepilin-type processing-associated H-X9-DG protein